MNKKNKILITSLAVLVVIIGCYLLFKKTPVLNTKISGTVSSVVDKPNQAEDGYYGFDVTSSSGQKYTINATGYLNTPLSPESVGEACIQVPKVKNGDKVEFNLPKSPDQANTFVICYKKDMTGYFFNLD